MRRDPFLWFVLTVVGVLALAWLLSLAYDAGWTAGWNQGIR